MCIAGSGTFDSLLYLLAGGVISLHRCYNQNKNSLHAGSSYQENEHFGFTSHDLQAFAKEYWRTKSVTLAFLLEDLFGL